MAQTQPIKLKRHTTGAALTIGTAPLTTGVGGIQSGEAVYDAIADILYIGKGDDGNGNSTAISAIGGGGAFLKSALAGAANGIATLDGTGKLTAAQIPASLVGGMNYQGVWNAATNTPQLLSGAGTKGYFYKVSASGVRVAGLTVATAQASAGNVVNVSSVTGIAVGMQIKDANGYIANNPVTTVVSISGNNVTLSAPTTTALAAGAALTFLTYLDGVFGTNFQIGDMVAFDGTTWDKLDGPAEAVTTVAGRTGAISLYAADLTDSGATGQTLIQAATPAAAKTALSLAVADVAGAAPSASPAFTGAPTAPTPAAGDNSTKIATTAFVAGMTIDGGAI